MKRTIFTLISTVFFFACSSNEVNQIQSLDKIWIGEEINKVRAAHVEGRINEIPVCSKCPFKDTYKWESL